MSKIKSIVIKSRWCKSLTLPLPSCSRLFDFFRSSRVVRKRTIRTLDFVFRCVRLLKYGKAAWIRIKAIRAGVMRRNRIVWPWLEYRDTHSRTHINKGVTSETICLYKQIIVLRFNLFVFRLRILYLRLKAFHRGLRLDEIRLKHSDLLTKKRNMLALDGGRAMLFNELFNGGEYIGDFHSGCVNFQSNVKVSAPARKEGE